jgi:hypothetical protein
VNGVRSAAMASSIDGKVGLVACGLAVIAGAGCARGAPKTTTPIANGDAGVAAPATADAGTTAAVPCKNADLEMEQLLSIQGAGGGIVTGIELFAGDERVLLLGRASSFAPFDPFPACARWTVSPQEAATIDAMTGLLRVSSSAAGKTLTVRATLVRSARVVEGTFRVVAIDEKAVVGVWHEEARLDCATNAWSTTNASIRELAIKAGGKFGVTWAPFETYVDYWGEWVWDTKTRALHLTIAGGNYTPADFDGDGTSTIEGKALVLRDVWLGSKQGGPEPKTCGHRFVR